MPHQRPQRPGAQAQTSGTETAAAAQPSRPATPQQFFLADLARDVKALNSAVLVLGQKMQYLVRNEKVLGRNLLVLNKRIEDLQQRKSPELEGLSSKEIQSLKQGIEANAAELGRVNQNLIELRDSLEQVKINYAKIEDVKELKFVIDALNPLEFVSVKQLDALVEKKLQEQRKK